MVSKVRGIGLWVAAMLLSGAGMAVCGSAQAQAGGSPLPGGASSLSETYKDWSVSCAQQGAAKQCAMSQVQTQQNGQRVLAVELLPPNGAAVAGSLVLPFGLALDAGVTLQVDDKPKPAPVHFRTCVPAGCIVPLTMDVQMLADLRAGAVLKVLAVADGGAAAPFSISLQGFGTALDRLTALWR